MIAIGVDVGGTSIKGAAVDSNGKVYEVFSMPTDKNMKGEEVVNKLCQLIKNYINEQKFEEAILGIGIGIPGVIDSEKNHAKIMYGSYGSGKSHFLTIFSAILSKINTDTNEYKSFISKLRKYKPELTNKVENYVKSTKLYYQI